MKINYKKTFAILLSSIIILPSIAFAAGLIPCDGSVSKPCDFNAAITFINSGINKFTLYFAIPLASITFAYAGANILLHPDNPEEIKNAKSMFSKTIVGMLIVLGAWLVMHTILSKILNPDALRFLGK